MSDSTKPKVSRAGAFDIRSFIALLIGIYGLVLFVVGLTTHSDADLGKAGGVHVNLYAGIVMLVFAGLFQAWAMWRPVIVPDDDGGE